MKSWHISGLGTSAYAPAIVTWVAPPSLPPPPPLGPMSGFVRDLTPLIGLWFFRLIISVQHLLDAASIPLHTPIGDSLKSIVNLMASEKVPVPVATFLAGGRLIALNKGKEGNPPDVRPIAVGETLRRLTGKCICAIQRDKISSFFQPSQFGVACKAGAEKIVHSFRRCIEENWLNGDFVVFN